MMWLDLITIIMVEMNLIITKYKQPSTFTLKRHNIDMEEFKSKVDISDTIMINNDISSCII